MKFNIVVTAALILGGMFAGCAPRKAIMMTGEGGAAGTKAGSGGSEAGGAAGESPGGTGGLAGEGGASGSGDAGTGAASGEGGSAGMGGLAGEAGSAGLGGASGDGGDGGSAGTGVGGSSGTGGDLDGEWRWATIPAGGTVYVSGVAALPDGSVYITGSFSGSVTFGSTTLTSNGGEDVFLVKCNSDGQVVWGVSAGGTQGDVAASVALLADGSAYITGSFQESAIFGSTVLPSAGSDDDVFLAKYDTNGNVLWATSAGGAYYNFGKAVAVLADGSAYITGQFWSDMTFGSTTLTTTEGKSLFLAKYDANGNALWARMGSSVKAHGASLATLPDGSVYITGIFDKHITFGSTTIRGNQDDGNPSTLLNPPDTFLAKYDTNGEALWAKGAEGTSKSGESLAARADGSVYLAGTYAAVQGQDVASVTFETTTLTSTNPNNAFLVQFDAGGNVIWARNAIDANSGDTSVGVLADGSAYLVGQVYSNGIDDVTHTFLAKYDSSGDRVGVQSIGGSHFNDSLAALADGSVFVTGNFSKSTTFGEITLISTGVDPSSTSPFLAKWQEGAGRW